jgi:hypothetical protein
MHSWGDKDFTYWNELNEAAKYIATFCERWGWICVTQYKEKWGTVRVYCSFGFYQLGQMLSPSTMYYGNWPWYSRWTWRIYLPRWINTLITPYQTWVYRLAYKNAIKKWPMIRKEILAGADWDEYLAGL